MSSQTPATSPRIIELDDVASTSTEAMARLASGERGPLWIRAERQTGGRGRSGRGWSSPEGNLAASLLFEPGCPIADVHQLALLAGVAVHDALDRAAPTAAIRLKWPNDVLIDGAKLGGILTESTTFGGSLVVVIGVGVNVAAAPELAGRPTARLADHTDQDAISPQALLSSLAVRFEHWLARWDRGKDFDSVRAAWLERALPLGHAMTIQSGAGPVPGLFAGLDPTGALILDLTNGQQRRFSYGDVTLEPAKDKQP